jgi:hypothetical protein
MDAGRQVAGSLRVSLVTAIGNMHSPFVKEPRSRIDDYVQYILLDQSTVAYQVQLIG